MFLRRYPVLEILSGRSRFKKPSRNYTLDEVNNFYSDFKNGGLSSQDFMNYLADVINNNDKKIKEDHDFRNALETIIVDAIGKDDSLLRKLSNE